MTNNIGATRADWKLWHKELKCTADLLPVVSNADAEIAPKSTMRAIGKTPSMYNADRQVVGLGKWTKRKTHPVQLKEWVNEPDYGICLQTRNVRAYDIDVDDEDEVKKIIKIIEDELGITLPKRWRENSPKCLLAFRLEGDYGKRVLPTKHGMVEFLATGQQFVAAGTHPSGVRYQWEGIENGIPVIDAEAFEDTFFWLEQEVATRSAKRRSVRKRSDADMICADDVLSYLEDAGLVMEYGSDNQAFIQCPFEDEHTSAYNPTATAYFPAGTGDYAQGHFVCLHAHCANRDDMEFKNALGYTAEGFEVIEDVDEKTGESKDIYKPPYMDRDKQGKPYATLANVAAALRDPIFCGCEVKYDRFLDQIIFREGEGSWEAENDKRFVDLRIFLATARDFHPVPKEIMRDAVTSVAGDFAIDTAIEWLNSLEWDGVCRLDRFLAEYMGAEDTEYTRAVGHYMWTAMAGRVLDPGCKVDMIPIMKGPQGFRKSTAVALLAPSPEQFCEIELDANDEDNARKLRGVLVAEIPELRGLRTRAIEAIKAWTTRTHEKWVPKWKEFATTFPRRCLFIATTNDDEFLGDGTGNRRWLPFEVVRMTDTNALKRDRDQLWAEARELYLKHGNVLFREAEELAREEHDQYRLTGVWEDLIASWMYSTDEELGDSPAPCQKGYVTVAEVAADGLGIDVRRMTKTDELKIADALRAIGCKSERRRVVDYYGTQRRMRVWVPPINQN